jgi:hypothetical protein
MDINYSNRVYILNLLFLDDAFLASISFFIALRDLRKESYLNVILNKELYISDLGKFTHFLQLCYGKN